MTLPVYQNLDAVGRPSAGGTALTAWGDAVDDDIAFLFGETAWTVPTFTNGWADGAASFGTDPAGFKLEGNTVRCRGTIKSGTIGLIVFTFPPGYRPLGTKIFAVASNNLFGEVTVIAAGALSVAVGSNASVSLDQVFFDIV